jgi:Zn ribbon nucleic-acid-binding protein
MMPLNDMIERWTCSQCGHKQLPYVWTDGEVAYHHCANCRFRKYLGRKDEVCHDKS